MERIAPKGGYNFKEKSTYRNQIWKIFKDRLQPDAKIAFLPSKEGLEIPIALACGFKEENLYAIDKSAAVLATAKWRKTYPKVNIIGIEVARAGDRLRKEGVVISAANLDLCGNLSRAMIDSVRGFINSNCFDGDGLIAINLLKGRESTEVNEMAEILFKYLNKEVPNMAKRNGTVMALASEDYGEFIPIESGEYRSGTITMSWSVCQLFGTQFFDTVDKERKQRAYDSYMYTVDKLMPDIEEMNKLIKLHDSTAENKSEADKKVYDKAVKLQKKIRRLKEGPLDEFIREFSSFFYKSKTDLGIEHPFYEWGLLWEHNQFLKKADSWYPKERWRQGRSTGQWGW